MFVGWGLLFKTQARGGVDCFQRLGREMWVDVIRLKDSFSSPGKRVFMLD